MVYRLNETTWLQDVGGGAEIFYFLNWAMLTIAIYCSGLLLFHATPAAHAAQAEPIDRP